MAATSLLGGRGRALWGQLLAQDVALADELNPRREVALSACRTADRLGALESIAGPDAPVVALAGEIRRQSVALAQLVAWLRLPDVMTGARPQRRGARGVYVSTRQAPPSSLARVRARKGR